MSYYRTSNTKTLFLVLFMARKFSISSSFRDYPVSHYVFGEVRGCSCGYPNCSDNHKRYGDVVMPHQEFTLDTIADYIIGEKRLD